MKRLIILVAIVLASCQYSVASIISGIGSIGVMTNVAQFGSILGTANLNDGCCFTPVPSNKYASSGMILRGVPGNSPDDQLYTNANSFSTILPGIVSTGHAVLPSYEVASGLFSPPIEGGGQQSGAYGIYGLTATFTIPITQFAMTLSKNGTQYITAWRADGTLIGQVVFQPLGHSSFVGLSTYSEPIAMVTVGNDDVFNGAAYDYVGTTPSFDNLIWGVPEPSTCSLLAIAGMISSLTRRRKTPSHHRG